MTALAPVPEFLPGTVWLTGAGPGDPALLTLAAAHGLATADVIIYDALVAKEILALAPPGVPLEDAGKRGGRPSAKQRDISESLIRHARAGRRVLRLKGGDPFTFGRGAEECLALVDADIRFRIVPGVTAGTAALSYAGIPATSRETNSGICFLTGHAASGQVPEDIDWAALSRAAPVLVFYMASKHLGEISDKLLSAGRRPDEPVAIISDATTPRQQVMTTKLATCAAEFAMNPLPPPVLVAVGPVVRYREVLNWFDP